MCIYYWEIRCEFKELCNNNNQKCFIVHKLIKIMLKSENYLWFSSVLKRCKKNFLQLPGKFLTSQVYGNVFACVSVYVGMRVCVCALKNIYVLLLKDFRVA